MAGKWRKKKLAQVVSENIFPSRHRGRSDSMHMRTWMGRVLLLGEGQSSQCMFGTHPGLAPILGAHWSAVQVNTGGRGCPGSP